MGNRSDTRPTQHPEDSRIDALREAVTVEVYPVCHRAVPRLTMVSVPSPLTGHRGMGGRTAVPRAIATMRPPCPIISCGDGTIPLRIEREWKTANLPAEVERDGRPCDDEDGQEPQEHGDEEGG
jgi:hypothetical protein